MDRQSEAATALWQWATMVGKFPRAQKAVSRCARCRDPKRTITACAIGEY